MYGLEIRESVDRIFRKLSKKDRVSFEFIRRKIEEIRRDPRHFKPLRKPMQNFRRVHVGSYVLIYSIDEKRKRVVIERYKHHDDVYRV